MLLLYLFNIDYKKKNIFISINKGNGRRADVCLENSNNSNQLIISNIKWWGGGRERKERSNKKRKKENGYSKKVKAVIMIM